MPVIEVQGRRDDPVVMAGPDGRSVTLLPMALTTVIEEQAGVYDFQLRQVDARTLALRLPGDDEAAAAAMARCRAALLAFAATQGVKGLRLLEETGKPVRRGRSGKACRVIAGGH